MKYFCNPVNINYRYQFNMDPREGALKVAREAADPSMIYFKGKYYIFASMNLSVWVSEDLAHWESHRLPENLPLYDYAPDVRVMGEYVYFSASRRGEVCNFYRTKDILNGEYEEIPGTFDFWDPNLFVDDDKKSVFLLGMFQYNTALGRGDGSETMLPLGERQVMIEGDAFAKGYERAGEDHCQWPLSDEEIEIRFQEILKMNHQTEEQLPERTSSVD